MKKYYNKEIPTEINCVYGGRHSGKTYYEFNKIIKENERLKAEIDLLNDNRIYLNNKIDKAIEYIETTETYDDVIGYYLIKDSDIKEELQELLKILKGEEK